MELIKRKTYYKPTPLLDKKETGWIFPQCQSFLNNMNPDEDQGFYETLRLKRQGKYPDYTPKFSGQKLGRGAKLTDFLSSWLGYYNFLLSPRAYAVFNKLNYGNHKVYLVRVYARLKPYLYYFPYFLYNSTDVIIWEKCNFYATKFALKNKDVDSIYDKKVNVDIPIFNTREEFLYFVKSNETTSLNCDRIAVDHQFPLDLDYIEFKEFGPLISERFVDEYHQNRLTGLQFERKIEIEQYLIE